MVKPVRKELKKEIEKYFADDEILYNWAHNADDEHLMALSFIMMAREFNKNKE